MILASDGTGIYPDCIHQQPGMASLLCLQSSGCCLSSDILTAVHSLCLLFASVVTLYSLCLSACLSLFKSLAFTTSHFLPVQYISCQTKQSPARGGLSVLLDRFSVIR